MFTTCSLLVLFPFHLEPFFLASSSDFHLFSVCDPRNLIRIACQSTSRRLLLECGQLISATPLKAHSIPSSYNHWVLRVLQGGAEPSGPFPVCVSIDEQFIDPVLCRSCSDNHSHNDFFHSVYLALEGWGWLSCPRTLACCKFLH